MINQNSFFRLVLTFLMIPALLGSGAFIGSALADAQYWIVVESKSALFKAKMPHRYEEIFKSIRIGPNVIASVGENHATIDQNPYVNAEKKYIVKFEQTVGGYLTSVEREKFLNRELNKYVEFYKAQGGEVLSLKNDDFQFSFPANEIQVTYDSEQFGKQYARIRLIATDVSIIHQIVMGPENTMNSYQTRDYFSSFLPLEGFKWKPGKIEEEWKEYISPLHIFKTHLPSETSEFMPEAPNIQHSETVERILTRFYDPVWEESLFYNLYGYRTERLMTYYDAEELLKSRHILRHRKTIGSATCTHVKNLDLPVVECQYTIIPPEGFPYLTNARLRATFFKNYIMVSELMASHTLINTSFMQELILKGEFLRGPPK